MNKAAPPLIPALLKAACYPHAVGRIAVMETHISWVLLTGRFAYKIKKPVNLGFVDFSSLKKRRRYCLEELRLNRRLAPQIYLDVVAIRGDPGSLHVGGRGPVAEYAVKMRQFPQDALASRALASGKFGKPEVDGLAELVAAFHAASRPAPAGNAFGTPASVLASALQNFEQMLPLAASRSDRARLLALRQWTRREHAALRDAFEARKSAGFVRECHGDLHLGNIAMLDGKPVPFDCIEFNEEFRWIDVMSEVAFLVMDLDDRGRGDLGWRFLNRYLEITGDHGGIRALRYYLVYRSLVRAKVHLMRSRQPRVDARERSRLTRAFRSYLGLARRYAEPGRAAVIITHGLSGSGKSTMSRPLAEQLGAIHVRSDVERKRLHGMDALARSTSIPGNGIYSRAATAATYRRLGSLARLAVEHGFSVIVDAAFLKRAEREAFRAIAEQCGARFAILDVRAPLEVLRARVSARAARGNDASEASLAVLEHQVSTCEPFTPAEMEAAVKVDGTRSREKALLQRLRHINI